MMENDTQNSQQAASTALHNAPKLAKIAQAGVQGGPAGAATEAAVQYCKEILVVAIAVLLLPVLVLLLSVIRSLLSLAPGCRRCFQQPRILYRRCGRNL